MIKKLLTLCLVFTIIVSTSGLTLTSNAVETPDKPSGTVNLTEESASTFEDGDYEYEITYNGSIKITKYWGNDIKIVIPSEIDNKTVTSIGNGAFSECENVTSIFIPSSVVTMGDYAVFSGALKEITVDENNNNFCSVDGVLFNKNKTEIITFPSVKSDNYSIPNSVTSISDYAFASTQIKNIVIPNSVRSVGRYAFASTPITNISLPESITSIRDYAFYWCMNLNNIQLPKSMNYIGKNVFGYCMSLNGIQVDNENTKYCSVEGVLFNKNRTEIITCPMNKEGKYTIPNGVTSIADYCFSGCANLSSVVIPNGVASIGDYSFSSTGITSVSLPNSVTSLGEGAFANCNNLEKIIISANINLIKDSVFIGCDNLKEITVDSKNTNYCSVNGVLFNKDKSELIAFPSDKTGNYSIPNGVVKIADYAFYRCTGLESVSIPNTVKTIGDSAFYECSGLKSVSISNGVETIGKSAFGSTALKNVTIPGSVTAIGDDAFAICEQLSDLVLSNGIISIGDQAFTFCNELTDVKIPDSVISIGGYAFSNCKKLENVSLSKNLSALEAGTFFNTKLTGIYIPEKVSYIGIQALSFCNGMKEITVDDKNETYSSDNGVLFDKKKTKLIVCPKSKTGNYKIPEGVVSIENEAFSGCEISEIVIPKSVISIGEQAFFLCSYLEKINVDSNNKSYSSLDGVLFDKSKTCLVAYPSGKVGNYSIPNGVVSIETFSFSGCWLTNKVAIPDSVTSIDNSAFYCWDMTIYGNKGSCAESYANRKGFDFKPLSEFAAIITTNMVGDLDDDGKITSADSLQILRQSVNLEHFDDVHKGLADVDNDGSITSADALEVLRYSVSLPTNGSIGEIRK